MNYVYWIYSDESLSVKEHGYVGVTHDPSVRFKSHLKKTKNIAKDAKMKILYEGSRDECFNLEFSLRPEPGIGWNRAVGGSHGWRHGFIHNESAKQKMRAAWNEERKAAASELKAKLNKELIGQKRPKQSQSISGDKNPMYGKTHTEESRQKIREANLGKPSSNKIEMYCIHCHKLVNPTNLKKYHDVGKKNCLVK